MRDDVLDPKLRAALSALSPVAERGYYLAGGTALCMHLAHRRSADLDLFRQEPFDADATVADLLASGVPLESVDLSKSTVHARVLGVPTSLLAFPYPTLEPPVPGIAAIPVAGVRDLAAMKLEAVASRGARKDFYDIYFLCKSGLSLADVIAAFQERFAGARPDIYHRLRALTYFDDAEKEPEPQLLVRVDWADVRRFFQNEVREIWRGGTGS